MWSLRLKTYQKSIPEGKDFVRLWIWSLPFHNYFPFCQTRTDAATTHCDTGVEFSVLRIKNDQTYRLKQFRGFNVDTEIKHNEVWRTWNCHVLVLCECISSFLRHVAHGSLVYFCLSENTNMAFNKYFIVVLFFLCSKYDFVAVFFFIVPACTHKHTHAHVQH